VRRVRIDIEATKFREGNVATGPASTVGAHPAMSAVVEAENPSPDEARVFLLSGGGSWKSAFAVIGLG